MPLDFPTSPTNGQIYDNYYWDQANGVWNSLGNYAVPNLLSNGTFTSSGSSIVPLTVKGAASQAANLQEWKNTSGTTLASISASGGLTLNNALTVANGGTGATSLTSGAYLKGNGASTLATQTGIPAGDITSGQIGHLRMPTGSVLQVLQTVKYDTFTVSSANQTYYDITGLSVSITPKSTSSKILINATVQGVSTYDGGLRLVRDSTVIGVPSGGWTNNLSFFGVRGATYEAYTSGGSFLDSPATTSTLTYKVQCTGSSNTLIYVNRTPNSDTDERTISSITVMEIAG